ncbi:hypothetical protein HQ584_03340 [Patescibacteria group bacterium]|nr:hypothetical protein [Patescibacteria group bacterium]
MRFTYLEKYGGAEVRRSVVLDRKSLKPGKWFYLRAPKIFIEKILPKLTYKLGDFAEIKFGIKTGANDFFYMKDISQLYEADYLVNPKKFEEWGVKAGTKEELEKQGLIYIENRIGKKFAINIKDVSPLIKSPTELDSYIINEPTNLIFKPNPENKPGKESLKYIKWGEYQNVRIQKGKNKGDFIKGYNNLRTTKAHKPYWYNVPDLKPAHIIPNRFIKERHFVSLSSTPVLAGDACALVYPQKDKIMNVWYYMNSTVYYLVEELYGMRMGGGGAPLQILAGSYKALPCFNLNNLNEDEDKIELLNRTVLPFKEELKNEKRRKLDIYVLETIGFKEPEEIVEKLYESYVEVVNDRIVKGKSSKKSN